MQLHFLEIDCYEQDPVSGFWRFNNKKLTPEMLASMKKKPMPNAYFDSVERVLSNSGEAICLVQNFKRFKTQKEEKAIRKEAV